MGERRRREHVAVAGLAGEELVVRALGHDPAVVEQDDATTLIPDGFRGTVDSLNNIVIEVR